MADSRPSEVLEILDNERELVVRTVVNGQTVAEAMEEARELSILADVRLRRLIAAQHKIGALEEEAAGLAAQAHDAKQALADQQAQAQKAQEEGHRRLQTVTDNLNCGVCSEILNDPVILIPCGHTACARCAWRWMRDRMTQGADLLCTGCQTRLTARPVRDVALRQTADAAMSLLNPQRLEARQKKRSVGFENGSAWDDFIF
ncbi:hypothetical protein K525DRAFT_264790 [Schizophyllum commune Loenen D]|nr:hypothetical protein K525DRAFT_264790 [Schizophyllum commune Loenen D]